MTPSDIIDAWHEAALALLPPESLVIDGHTHTGDSDPDGFHNTAERLVELLVEAGHSGAVIMPHANPSGYEAANRRVLEEAGAHAGALFAFARIDPRRDGAGRETEAALDDGHSGIKLHPRAERFTLDHRGVAEVAQIAADRGVPVLVHAGRGIPALGEDAARLISQVEGLHLIMAHCAISDLAWLGPRAADIQGLFFDTSWWSPADHNALAAAVPASRILYASDTPYGQPRFNATLAARSLAWAGHEGNDLAKVFSGNLTGLLDGKHPEDGSATNGISHEHRPELLRIYTYLVGAVSAIRSGAEIDEPVSLALQAASTAPHRNLEDLYEVISRTIGAVFDSGISRRQQLGLILAAASAALTPQVPTPQW